MKTYLLSFIFTVAIVFSATSNQQQAGVTTGKNTQKYEANWESLSKRQIPEWFHQEKFGIFIHWGVYSVPSFANVMADGYSEWYWANLLYPTRHSHKEIVEFHEKNYGMDFSYFRFAPMFKAELFKPEQWAETFRKSNARYVVLTSKHHDGFCLWPNEAANAAYMQPWNASSVGPERDLLGELTDAVRKEGLRMGYYYSLYEWQHPLWNSDKEKYVDQHLFPQLKELVSKYKPSIIFSDGEWDLTAEQWRSTELLAWLFNENPELVVNDRWGKDTRSKYPCTYFSSEYGSGMDANVVWEETMGMGESFAYNRMERASDYKSVRELLLVLCDNVSRGGNLLLDIGPAADGSIPVVMEDRLLGIGKWLDRYGDAIFGTRAWNTPHQWSKGKLPEISNEAYQSGYNINTLTTPKNNGEAHIETMFTRKGNLLNVIVPNYKEKIVINDVKNVKRAYIPGCNKKIEFKATGKGTEINLSNLKPGDVDDLFVVVLVLDF